MCIAVVETAKWPHVTVVHPENPDCSPTGIRLLLAGPLKVIDFRMAPDGSSNFDFAVEAVANDSAIRHALLDIVEACSLVNVQECSGVVDAVVGERFDELDSAGNSLVHDAPELVVYASKALR